MAELVKYNKGQPTEQGVYACRVENPDAGFPLLHDRFLIWINGRWSYLGSDQYYRGKVLGWVGPLQRKMEKK